MVSNIIMILQVWRTSVTNRSQRTTHFEPLQFYLITCTYWTRWRA